MKHIAPWKRAAHLKDKTIGLVAELGHQLVEHIRSPVQLVKLLSPHSEGLLVVIVPESAAHLPRHKLFFMQNRLGCWPRLTKTIHAGFLDAVVKMCHVLEGVTRDSLLQGQELIFVA